ncbi:hypothetical protein H6F42_12355 [Pseudanabaena sp. FACHB-1998]|uniref:hypothetical protein n=1 Tax=Pseudanabaena sp. FACHB-1998 TaxID=2692858 RepID=UPI0016817EE1|nr:hypothetical protein [Pseudanabaena sp. FACHB-1998]MBD2177707.1 hypothetical protein [Pseudanabaena sp. FACHB-1998]
MLLNQKSLRNRFCAIWTSILAVIPEDYADRLAILTEAVVKDKIDSLSLSFLANPLDLSVLAIAIGAYWHQDLQEVRSRILDLQNYSKADISELVLAYAIAYGCRGELQPLLLVRQIYTDFSPRRSLSPHPHNFQNCLAQLQLAQQFVECGASAITVHRANTGISAAIASSFYYFLSTPHNWQIVIERAKRHNCNQQNDAEVRSLISLQSGAIAATYLGELGEIKIGLNTLVDSNYQGKFPKQAKQQEIWQKGEIMGRQVWAEWTGIYESSQQ